VDLNCPNPPSLLSSLPMAIKDAGIEESLLSDIVVVVVVV
jgi:hypothetical protein